MANKAIINSNYKLLGRTFVIAQTCIEIKRAYGKFGNIDTTVWDGYKDVFDPDFEFLKPLEVYIPFGNNIVYSDGIVGIFLCGNYNDSSGEKISGLQLKEITDVFEKIKLNLKKYEIDIEPQLI